MIIESTAPEEEFRRINRLVVHGRFQQALRRCQTLLRTYPTDPRVLAMKARLDAETKVIDFDQAQVIVRELIKQHPDNERLPVIAATLAWRGGQREFAINQLRQISEENSRNPYVHEVLAGLLPTSVENYGEAWQNYQVAMQSGPLSSLCHKSMAYYLGKRIDPEHAASALEATSSVERAAIRTRAWGVTAILAVFLVAGVGAVALRLFGYEFAAVVLLCGATVWAGWVIYSNDLGCCRKCRDAWIAATVMLWIVYLSAPHFRPSAIPIGIGAGVGLLIANALDASKRKYSIGKILRRFITFAFFVAVLVTAAVFSHVGKYPGAVTFNIPVKGQITAMTMSPNGKYVYLVEINMGSILVVNTSSRDLTKVQIHPGANVTDAAVSPNGREIYVTSNGSNSAGYSRTVYVVNAEDNRVMSKINVGGSSAVVAFSPDGRTAYVAADASFRSGAALLFINVATQKVTAVMSINPGASIITVNPNGKSVYVASDGSTGTNGTFPTAVQVIDVKRKKVVATLGPKNSGACGMALNPGGTTLYVSFCSVYGTSVSDIPPLQVINTANNSVTSTIEIAGGSRGIAVSPDGGVVFTASDMQYGIDAVDARSNSIIGLIPVATNSKFSTLNLVNMTSSGRYIYSTSSGFFLIPNSQFSEIALKSNG